MQIICEAFVDGAPIPAVHTCQGRNTSPALKWSDLPPGAKSLALICDDPDAPGGTWVHWVLYDLPATVSGLPEECPKSQYIPAGAKQGLNDFGHLGYGGPCPPPGKAHRYFLKLFALDSFLDLKPGLTKVALEARMRDHILDQTQIIGLYQRK